MTEVPHTLYDKIWDAHVVASAPGYPDALFCDLHLVHEGTFLQAFEALRERSADVRRRELTLAVTDHFVPTKSELRFGSIDKMPYVVGSLIEAAHEFNLRVLEPNDPEQGIVHVIGPELGLTQPGMVVVCADSHTTTHGALGAIAIGIGTTEVGHVLATQMLIQRKQRSLRVSIEGNLGAGVTSKDVALHLLSVHGTDFGRGYAIEFAGCAVESMSIEARMSLCNMSIEMGSKTAIIAPDETTIDYVLSRKHAPTGAARDEAVQLWRSLRSDPDAQFDHEITIDAGSIEPYVTYGTTPAMGGPIARPIPEPSAITDAETRDALTTALDYMGLTAGTSMAGQRVDRVFIGSCTNSRLEDIRLAASVLKGRHVAPDTHLMVVPGSQAVKRQAEAEGLDVIVREAGGNWEQPSCSLCIGVNGDLANPGEYVASTSNRNFQHRQGKDARTLLLSPLTAAASAINGYITDPREFLDPAEAAR